MDVSQKLITFVSRFMELTEIEKSWLETNHSFRSVSEGEILVDHKSLSDESFLLLSGILCRRRVNDCGKISVFDFYSVDYPIVSPLSNGIDPAESELICIKSAIITSSTPSEDDRFLIQFPRFERVCRLLAEENLRKANHAFDCFRELSIEDRYRYLVEHRPYLFQNVPQYMLASYIGVKPESLSRIRRRIVQRNRDKLNS